MAYGDRRSIRNPGEFRAGDIAGLAAASGFGLVGALSADYFLKGQASAFVTLSELAVAVGRAAGLGDLPLWSVALALVLIGAVSVLLFQPVTRLGAFARGFGLLAAIMAATPTDIPSGLASIDRHADSAPSELAGSAASKPGSSAASVDAAEQFVVLVRIVFPGGAPQNFEELARTGRLRGRLHNEATGATFDLFRTAGASLSGDGAAIEIRAGVPTDTERANLWVRIEAEGYGIELQSAEASLARPLEWTIELRKSSVPLNLQRFGKSIWF